MTGALATGDFQMQGRFYHQNQESTQSIYQDGAEGGGFRAVDNPRALFMSITGLAEKLRRVGRHQRVPVLLKPWS